MNFFTITIILVEFQFIHMLTVEINFGVFGFLKILNKILSWMIKIWMTNYDLVSHTNCDIRNPQCPFIFESNRNIVRFTFSISDTT